MSEDGIVLDARIFKVLDFEGDVIGVEMLTETGEYFVSCNQELWPGVRAGRFPKGYAGDGIQLKDFPRVPLSMGKGSGMILDEHVGSVLMEHKKEISVFKEYSIFKMDKQRGGATHVAVNALGEPMLFLSLDQEDKWLVHSNVDYGGKVDLFLGNDVNLNLFNSRVKKEE